MKKIIAFLTPFFLVFAQPLAWALPSGEQVVSGTAEFQRSLDSLTVTNSAGAIIEWQNFSIAAGHTTSFVQPSVDSAILNRVVGGDISAIYGTLQSNGVVYLVNPSGIIVGPSGLIDTAGFVASTLNVTNQDFLNGGTTSFVGESTATITNLGEINALNGDVFLIARSIENAGTISAAQGKAGLYAGHEVILAEEGSAAVRVGSVTVSGDEVAEGIKNSGVIEAAQIELAAAGGNLYALAINHSGIARATGTVEKDGIVYFTSDDDAIVVSGDVAAQNADGSGGSIYIGGDREGTLPKAERT